MGRTALALLLFIVSCPLGAQYLPRHTAQPNATAATGAYKEPAATMRGVLHKLSAKEVVIITEGDQSVLLVRTRKTKFLRNGKEVKPTEIALGSIVSVDVGKFADLTPQAVNVMVDGPPVDGASMQTKPQGRSDRMDEETPAEESASPSTQAPAAKPGADAAPKTSEPPTQMDQETPAEESPKQPPAKPSKPQSR